MDSLGKRPEFHLTDMYFFFFFFLVGWYRKDFMWQSPTVWTGQHKQ